MVKVRVLVMCEHCKGKAYVPVGEDVDFQGNKYIRHLPCPHCEGSGLVGKWIELPEFLLLLEQSKCPHVHTSRSGGFHYSGGEIWDDIRDVCGDCGEVL